MYLFDNPPTPLPPPSPPETRENKTKRHKNKNTRDTGSQSDKGTKFEFRVPVLVHITAFRVARTYSYTNFLFRYKNVLDIGMYFKRHFCKKSYGRYFSLLQQISSELSPLISASLKAIVTTKLVAQDAIQI